ncbi:hypothetical protein SAMD00019534_037770 [Acytostelium subglobosum LB1]|uniref:hypothetical protein n=1 Tax=Acytostelium subglobosum LB1 TaxID=1410327 RepID=UPI000644A11A|nr:hypothetical protein SAMD00019534_037770 [Acytostelium subglobosum LB1]GAM20602.1 hypothetical protein SAMD00019534_037770 [Acytostelium subglobosum LB1]|eukprot:XP_012760123.1 hypothetical protein SAMD00019534_037770 [Acytostelium subglobosum LB1]
MRYNFLIATLALLFAFGLSSTNAINPLTSSELTAIRWLISQYQLDWDGYATPATCNIIALGSKNKLECTVSNTRYTVSSINITDAGSASQDQGFPDQSLTALQFPNMAYLTIRTTNYAAKNQSIQIIDLLDNIINSKLRSLEITGPSQIMVVDPSWPKYLNSTLAYLTLTNLQLGSNLPIKFPSLYELTVTGITFANPANSVSFPLSSYSSIHRIILEYPADTSTTTLSCNSLTFPNILSIQISTHKAITLNVANNWIENVFLDSMNATSALSISPATVYLRSLSVRNAVVSPANLTKFVNLNSVSFVAVTMPTDFPPLNQLYV